MKFFDIVIVGGGASGLMCAVNLTHDFSVAIVDENSLGKKLLVTGNGRCNFTNSELDLDKYNTDKVKKFIKEFDQNKTREFFRKLGIESFSDDEGRVYPLSETAKDLQTALVNNLKNVVYIKDKVQKISKDRDFIIKLDSGETISSKKVVMACGNRDLEKILEDFKLPFAKKHRVLCGFKVKGFDKNLFGLREKAVVKFGDFREEGQIQFRKDGLSGIVIFNLSAKIKEMPFNIEIELLPDIEENKLVNILSFRRKNCGDLPVEELLMGILKPELAKFILKECKINQKNRTLSDLSDIEIESVSKKIKRLKFTCLERYDDCQVLSGGMDLQNLKNFQSNFNGLYFCGETTNVFGPCGGYNLQWAWSSGYCLAQEINRGDYD